MSTITTSVCRSQLNDSKSFLSYFSGQWKCWRNIFPNNTMSAKFGALNLVVNCRLTARNNFPQLLLIFLKLDFYSPLFLELNLDRLHVGKLIATFTFEDINLIFPVLICAFFWCFSSPQAVVCCYLTTAFPIRDRS